MGCVLQFSLVALFGGLVGAAELLPRYRNNPWRALDSRSGRIYVLVNAGAGVGALVLIKVFDWKFGQPAGTDSLAAIQMLVAGFGAMAFFRSSLFTVKVGDKDIGVGPSIVLTTFLRAIDSDIDRKAGAKRASEAVNKIKGLDFKAASNALPVLAVSMMQNFSKDDEAALVLAVAQVRKKEDLTDEAKLMVLALTVQSIFGQEILEKSVELLRDSMNPE